MAEHPAAKNDGSILASRGGIYLQTTISFAEPETTSQKAMGRKRGVKNDGGSS